MPIRHARIPRPLLGVPITVQKRDTICLRPESSGATDAIHVLHVVLIL